jgi:hypothetical protein
MTIKELMAQLQQYDENTRIQIFDAAYGIIDITDIFQSDRTGAVILS